MNIKINEIFMFFSNRKRLLNIISSKDIQAELKDVSKKYSVDYNESIFIFITSCLKYDLYFKHEKNLEQLYKIAVIYSISKEPFQSIEPKGPLSMKLSKPRPLSKIMLNTFASASRHFAVDFNKNDINYVKFELTITKYLSFFYELVNVG